MKSSASPFADPRRLRELAGLFLRLGSTAFGGPAAHLALMQDEVVRRRQWLSQEEFLDLLSVTQLIPGPNSTEMAIHIGHRRAGWAGLLVAGTCFILPAFLIVTCLAWAYVRFGDLPRAEGLLHGAKPAVVAVVFQALIGLARTALRSRTRIVVAVGSVLASFLGLNELVLLLMAGLAVVMAQGRRWDAGPGIRSMPVPPGTLLATGSLTATAVPLTLGLGPLFLFFVKVGSVLFGSGYVLFAFLRADLVDRWGWLTEDQLLDAIAVGQFTPGPLFTTATFIGYLLAGFPGGLVATVGIFLPAFVFVALSGPVVPRLRRSPFAAAMLDGVNAASWALMAVVLWHLTTTAVVDGLTFGLALISGVLVFTSRINPAWLVLGGALVGFVFLPV